MVRDAGEGAANPATLPCGYFFRILSIYWVPCPIPPGSSVRIIEKRLGLFVATRQFWTCKSPVPGGAEALIHTKYAEELCGQEGNGAKSRVPAEF